MKRFSEYTQLAEETLSKLEMPGAPFEGLYEPIRYSMTAGGKRLRPSLLLMSTEAFGGSCADAAKAAAGIEMFHNFTLLHDDVMDQSDMRRSRPTVHKKWDVNTAILSGDTMLTMATQYISEVPDGILRQTLDAFNAMAIRVYEGQRLDMDFENREDVSINEYIRMISDKTGALLGASAQIGALIGGASTEDAHKMAEYGEMLGIAFQIQDDWLDVYGDSVTFGKPIGGDINNNKKSYLLLKSLSTGNSDSEALREAMKMHSGEMKVKVVTRLYDKLGISRECQEEVNRYSKRAMAALKSTNLGDSEKEPFRLLVEKLTGRKK